MRGPAHRTRLTLLTLYCSACSKTAAEIAQTSIACDLHRQSFCGLFQKLKHIPMCYAANWGSHAAQTVLAAATAVDSVRVHYHATATAAHAASHALPWPATPPRARHRRASTVRTAASASHDGPVNICCHRISVLSQQAKHADNHALPAWPAALRARWRHARAPAQPPPPCGSTPRSAAQLPSHQTVQRITLPHGHTRS
jgi:hypothetical protein